LALILGVQKCQKRSGWKRRGNCSLINFFLIVIDACRRGCGCGGLGRFRFPQEETQKRKEEQGKEEGEKGKSGDLVILESGACLKLKYARLCSYE